MPPQAAPSPSPAAPCEGYEWYEWYEWRWFPLPCSGAELLQEEHASHLQRERHELAVHAVTLGQLQRVAKPLRLRVKANRLAHVVLVVKVPQDKTTWYLEYNPVLLFDSGLGDDDSGGALGGDGQAYAVASRGGGRERPVLDRDATPSRVARRASAVDTRFRRLPR